MNGLLSAALGTGAIVGIACGGVALILIIWLIGGYNSFVGKRNKTQEAFSTMDVYLKKRYDLIPNLVESVKGYSAHESETLRKVVEARNAAASAATPEQKIEANVGLGGALKSLFALSESYPDLKANQNFMNLQTQLKAVEEDIASARKYYNAVVNLFNTAIERFPGVLVAKMFGFSRKPLYEVSDAAERENVKVSFGG